MSNNNNKKDYFFDVPSLKSSAISFDVSSLTIPYGTNVQEDKPYIFSGMFYDTTDDTRVWSDPCYLETQFVLDSDVYANDSITNLDNFESKSPSNSSISMISGTQYQNGTLDQLDDDYAGFNSTDDNMVEATNFTVNHGTLISSGNHTEIDGNYSEYQSGYEIDAPEQPDDFEMTKGTSDWSGDLSSIDGNYTTFTSENFLSGNESRVVTDGNYIYGSFAGGAYSNSWINDSNSFQMASEFDIVHATRVIFVWNDTFSGDLYLSCYFTISISVNWLFYRNGNVGNIITSGTGTVVSLANYSAGSCSSIGFSIIAMSAHTTTAYYIEVMTEISEEFLDITTTFQYDIAERDLMLCYSQKTNISQTINIFLYNFDTETFDLINSSISLSFTSDFFTLNSSYYNASHHIIIEMVGTNTTNSFAMYLEMLLVRNSPILEVISNISCDLLDNVIYSFKTNVTQFMEFYIYNFTSSSYDLIENSSYLSFNLNYTTLHSDYHNGTSTIIKFYGMNNTFNDFMFYLEVLKIINITRLDLTMYVELDEFTDYLLALNCSAWYYTSILTLMNFSIYDFTNEEWILINSSSNDVDFYKSEYYENTADLYDLIDQDNDYQVLVRFNAINMTNEFDLYLDCLNMRLYRKLVLSYTKTFTLLGTWKYRFHIPEDGYSSAWIYFDVVLKEDNVEMISESNFLTTWQFIGGYDIDDVYQTGFTYWSLSGVSETNITIPLYDTFDYNLYDGYRFIEGDGDLTYDTYFSIPFQCSGITWDGTYHYVKQHGTDDVYLYDEEFNYVSYQTVSGGNWGEGGLCYNGTHFYSVHNSLSRVYVYDSTFTYVDDHYLGSGLNFGICWNGTHFFVADYYNDRVNVYDGGFSYQTYHSLPFGCVNIEWDGLYFYITDIDDNDILYKYDSTFSYVDDYILQGANYHQGLCYDNGYLYVTDRDAQKEYRYKTSYLVSFSKFYQSSTENIVYMQTNVSESISIKESLISDLELYYNDKIEITFNTTSSNEITFNLLNDESLLKSYTISNQGNINYNTRTINLNLDANYTVDQLKFTSLFVETDNLMVSNLTIYRYSELTDINSYDVNPSGLKKIYLTFPINYTYYVYEDNILKTTGYIYTSAELQTIVYERIDQQIVYITFHDVNNEYLDFPSFETRANYTYDGVDYENVLLSNDILYVDVETEIDFIVYDSFDEIIKETTRTAQTHIDIILSIYSFKMINEATKNVSYTITKGVIEKSGNIFSGEIIEFLIASGNYTLEYINYEDGNLRTENISLDDNTLFSINTIYFDVYFSLFNFDGLGLERELFRFYINNERKDLGFNTLIQDTNNLKVLDYFNASLFTQDVNLEGLSEYNIFVEVYTLIINNNYTRSIYIEIERNDIEIKQIIPAQASISYRFLPNIEYEIRCFDIEGDLLSKQEIKLDSNNKIVSFGFYSTEVPLDPTPIIADVYVMFWVVVMIAIFISVLTYLHYRLKRQVRNVPEHLIKRYNKKNDSNLGSYNNKLEVM